ncbi:hypothetical protein MPSEU_000963700 [Mayamaea pseudoterrestris]|nr:hypothetical protein MPSEU_000963700 [Mayamaea pseudoterrestris]
MTKHKRARCSSPSFVLRSCRWSFFVVWILFYHEWLATSSDSCSDIACRGYYRGWSMFAYAQDVSEEEDSRNGSPFIRRGKTRRDMRIRGGALPQATLQERQATDAAQFKSTQLVMTAFRKGLGGGVYGAFAGIIQVFTLMWLRTIMTYQLRYGTNFSQALHTLLRDGGIARLYRGLVFALVQAPLSRFVSTAANDGVNLLLGRLEATKSWSTARKVAIASLVVGFWRMVLMPIDTMKTVLQVDSVEGFRNLMRRIKAGRFGLLYQGTFATYISSVMGHFPWFWTYNMLESNAWLAKVIQWNLLRSAGIGFLASVVSDTVINSVRVIKTTKQSLGAKHSVSYSEAIRMVLAADGWKGLFGRGLGTRVMANAIQSVVFTVIWRSLADRHKGAHSSDEGSVE